MTTVKKCALCYIYTAAKEYLYNRVHILHISRSIFIFWGYTGITKHDLLLKKTTPYLFYTAPQFSSCFLNPHPTNILNIQGQPTGAPEDPKNKLQPS